MTPEKGGCKDKVFLKFGGEEPLHIFMIRQDICIRFRLCSSSAAMNSGGRFDEGERMTDGSTLSVRGRFRVWIDADACPKGAKELVMRMAFRRNIGVTFVANSYMRLPTSDLLELKLVDQGPDKADDYIVETAERADIVVTGDIPLAARLVKLSILTLNPRGEEYSDSNIGERLATRDLMESLRSAGAVTGGPKEYGSNDLQRFANVLDRAVTRRSMGR